MLVQRQIRHELLELLVLFPQLPQLPDLRRSEAPVLLLLPVERLLRDLKRAADIDNRRAGFHLPKGHGDLFFGKSALLHRRVLPASP